MEELLLRVMEFVITASIVTAAVGLVSVGISVGILYGTGLYKNKMAAIILPIVVAIPFGVASLSKYTSLEEWGFFLPALVLAPMMVSILCYRKRLKDKGYQSSTIS